LYFAYINLKKLDCNSILSAFFIDQKQRHALELEGTKKIMKQQTGHQHSSLMTFFPQEKKNWDGDQ